MCRALPTVHPLAALPVALLGLALAPTTDESRLSQTLVLRTLTHAKLAGPVATIMIGRDSAVSNKGEFNLAVGRW
jgi:hypothetical protein